MALRGRHGWALGLALLAGSFAAAAGASWFAYETYRELQAIRLDPAQLAFYAGDEPPPLAAGERRVVFFGDSRSAMWRPPAGVPGVQFVNRGIGYQTTAQALVRFDAEIPSLRPDVVVVQLGINDLKTLALFPEREREIVEGAFGRLRELVGRARRTGAKVIVVTIFPVGPVPLWRQPFWSDRVQRAVDEVNRRLVGLERPGVRLLVADAILRDGAQGLRDDYALDHLHLTSEAYEALNRRGLIPLLQ